MSSYLHTSIYFDDKSLTPATTFSDDDIRALLEDGLDEPRYAKGVLP